MARIRSRRADGSSPPAATEQGDAEAAEQPTVVVPPVPETAPAEQATEVQPAVEELAAEAQPAVEEQPAEPETAAEPEAATPEADAAEDVPAGAEPAEAATAPTIRNRGSLRRRLRYLRRVRELGFRDLGGLVFDLDRFGRDRPDLVRAKLDALGAMDSELRALETALDDERPIEELHEPGIAACFHCGTIFGSDARFCPACGNAAGTVPQPAPLPVEPVPTPVAEETPAPDPAAEAPPAEPAEPPATPAE